MTHEELLNRALKEENEKLKKQLDERCDRCIESDRKKFVEEKVTQLIELRNNYGEKVCIKITCCDYDDCTECALDRAIQIVRGEG